MGVTFLLKQGGDAGNSRISRLSTSIAAKGNGDPIYPGVIAGRLDNFKEAINLTPFQSWGEKAKYGFALGVASNRASAQPSVRLRLAHSNTFAMVLQIQYTVSEKALDAIAKDVASKANYDGVTVLVTTVGVAYNQSTLLSLNPVSIAEQRKWLTYNLALPTGTKEVHFSIIGPPPNYNVFEDSCIISLPQLRAIPAHVSP